MINLHATGIVADHISYTINPPDEKDCSSLFLFGLVFAEYRWPMLANTEMHYALFADLKTRYAISRLTKERSDSSGVHHCWISSAARQVMNYWNTVIAKRCKSMAKGF
ncbi:MAG: hypothetical protein P1V33_14240, partial [Pseudohongiella nitratireducens]